RFRTSLALPGGKLAGDVVDDTYPDLGRLRALQDMAVGDDEGGHGVHAAFAGMGVAGADIRGIGVGPEQPVDHRPVEARLGGDICKRFGIGQVAPVAPEGPEERRDHWRLPPFEAGPVDEPVRVERVRLARHPLEVQFHPCRRGMFEERQMRADRTLLAAELRLHVGTPVHAGPRQLWVELERVPLDCEGMVRARLERAVEVGLADVAPWAGDVRYDVQPYHWLAFHS